MLSRLIVIELRPLQYRSEVKPVGFPMLDGAPHVEHVGTTNRLIERTESEGSEVLAHFLRDEFEEIHHELRFSAKPGTELRVLRCHTYGTRVEVTHAHHDATRDDEWRRSKAKLFTAQQGSDNDVAACL